MEDLNDIKLPFIKEKVILVSPGVWNGIKFSEDSIKNSMLDTVFDNKNTSIYLNHEDNSVDKWIGTVENIKIVEGKQCGDLSIVDKDTAIKVAYGANFGISPKIRMIKDEQSNMISFEVINYSLVINPAIKDAYINEVKDMSEETKENVQPELSEHNTEVLCTKVETTQTTAPTETVEVVTEPAKAETTETVEVKEFENKAVETNEVKEEKVEVKELEVKVEDKIEEVSEFASMKKMLEGLIAKTEDPEIKHTCQVLIDLLEGKKVEPPKVEAPKPEVPVDGKKDEAKMSQNDDNELLDLNEQLLAALKESNSKIDLLEKVNAKFKDDLVKIEGEVTKFKEDKDAERISKFNSKVEEVTSKYVKFFGIPESDMNSTKQMLSKYSEDMLEKTNEYIEKKELEKAENEAEVITQPSSQLTSVSLNESEWERMSPQEKTRWLFNNKVMKN